MKRFRSKATVQGVVASDGVDWEPPSGQASRARMVARFSRLVWKLAAKMDRWGLARRWGEFDDLFQEGMVGLLNAMDLYDESTGVKFCTYAYIAIWRRISAVKNQGLIRVSTEQAAVPEENELDEKFNHACRVAYRQAMNVRQIPQNDDGKDADVFEASEDRESEVEESLEEVRKALRILKDRHRDIVVQRFGLEGDEPKTNREIGEQYGISKQAVQQQEEIAIAKLRNWLMESDSDMGDVARSKMFTSNQIPHPVNGEAMAVAPEPIEETQCN